MWKFWKEGLGSREVKVMPRSKCRYLGKETYCEVEVNDREITLKDLEGRVITTLKLNDVLSIEQRGNEFTITMKNGERISLMITRELLRRIMYITTLLELKGSAHKVLPTLRNCLLALSRTLSLLEEIMTRLRRGTTPDWDKITEISAELRDVILNDLLKRTTGMRAREVTDVLEEFSKNVELKYVNGIRMTARKLVGMLSNECITKLSHVLASVNFAVAVNVVLYIHSYCFAKRFGMRLEADTSKAKVVDTLSELLNNLFWLGGNEPKDVMTAVLKSLDSGDADENVGVFVNSLLNGICSHYSVRCPENMSS